jgi:hypothetical protein
LAQSGFGKTYRKDLWWVNPLLVFLGLTGFIIYTTWAALQGEYYSIGPYLSPYYSPELFGNSPHAIFGPAPSWWPAIIAYSPAFLILWAPAGMRFTCYYYRGSYYKSFWADPPACAVGEPRKKYWGENSLPLILQNAHRYFLYFAILFVIILSYDAWKAMWFTDSSGTTEFGIGVGTLVLTANAILIGAYTFSCHSFRHLVGGWKDQLSKAPTQRKVYNCVTCLNKSHMNWAWFSLVSVMFADLYVRLCAMGIWTDLRII